MEEPVKGWDWKSRKYWLVIAVISIATVALFIKTAAFAEWATFVQWIVGLYLGGNVGTKIATRFNGSPKPPAEFTKG